MDFVLLATEQNWVDFIYNFFENVFTKMTDIIGFLDSIYTYLGDFVAIMVNGVELFIEFVNNLISQSGLLMGFVAILPPIFIPFFFITIIGMIIRCVYGGG